MVWGSKRGSLLHFDVYMPLTSSELEQLSVLSFMTWLWRWSSFWMCFFLLGMSELLVASPCHVCLPWADGEAVLASSLEAGLPKQLHGHAVLQGSGVEEAGGSDHLNAHLKAK